MTFETLGSKNTTQDDRPSVDWAAYNDYIVETCNLHDPETLVGVVSGIISLGTQVPKPMEFLKGKDEDEDAEIEKTPYVSYEDREKFYSDGKLLTNVRVKVVPQKAQQLVALTIDFPDILLDRGQFFGGKDGMMPLRMIHGGEFFTEGERVVSKPISLKVKPEKPNNKWTIPFNNTLYKMAVACKEIKQGEVFLPANLDSLLGKAMQFKVQVAKNDAGYIVERCAFAAGLGRGQSVPEFDENLLFLIQMTANNGDSDINQLNRSGVSIKNTLKKSSEWQAGCVLRDQLENTDTKKPEKEKQEKSAEKDDDSFLDGFDDIPF